jgi:hypothetical protein
MGKDRMNFNQDQIAAIIGQKELELIAQRMQIRELTERLKKYEPQENVVPLEAAKAT